MLALTWVMLLGAAASKVEAPFGVANVDAATFS